MNVDIRFANGGLNRLRSTLLKDLNNEYLAILYGKTHTLNNGDIIITVKDMVYPDNHVYSNQSSSSLYVSGDFLAHCLHHIDERLDVDTVVHVHTHPFDPGIPSFSSVDDTDEKSLSKYLYDRAPEMHFASIVLSQNNYRARYWKMKDKSPTSFNATVRTQKLTESLKGDSESNDSVSQEQLEIYDRSYLALGRETMQSIMRDQTIAIIGVGGIGSIIAEHLVHMGFQSLLLIDQDVVEKSNLNRLVGARLEDAKDNSHKVDVLKRHIEEINPNVDVKVHRKSVFDVSTHDDIARSNWMYLTTDNYSSALKVQEVAFKYYVPFISSATNITVKENQIEDIRGEVVLVRPGDNVCLSCLKRIDRNELIKESHPDENIKKHLVQKGYVRGAEVKDPAIKTLNSTLATMAVDVLVNQYTERQKDYPILMYENNVIPTLYPELRSVRLRNKKCHICGGI